MRDQSTRPAAAWQEPTPTERYTQIANALHAMVESPLEFQFVSALLSFRWYPTSPIIPSVDTIASMLHRSHRTVRRVAARLEARGWILRNERRAEDKRQMSNRYDLCGDLLALVTSVEASRDQGGGQAWQGRRSTVTGKENSGKNTNRTRQQNGRHTPPSTGDFLETRYGRLETRYGRIAPRT